MICGTFPPRLRLDFEYGFYCAAAAVARMSGGAFMLIVIIISYHFYPRISVNTAFMAQA